MGTKLPSMFDTISIEPLNIKTFSLENILGEAQPYLNIALIKANGGTIVQCRAEQSNRWEYYIIPENCKNFDKELGKIISIFLVKS